jgi:tRNA (cmo5U34)-methyltransferase
MRMKSTVEEIRDRFDNEVERFSNLETGQSATIDAPLVLDLITAAAAVVCPQAQASLDIGCGAGNYTLKLLEKLPNLNATLIDLSANMLARARERIAPQTSGQITTLQADIRQVELGEQQFDVVVAGAVLHHLRAPEEWSAVFAKIHRSLKPGGCFWISDLIEHDHPGIHAEMWKRYGQYLARLRDEAYREKVFAYIDHEDTPASLEFQLQVLRDVGFQHVQVLHKHLCFAAFGGIKA